MTFIESSTDHASPLAQLAPADVLNDPREVVDEDFATQTNEPALEQPEYASLRDRLIEQISDINLARYLPRDVLTTIGQMVLREYTIDETSRAEWRDHAEKAMKFTLQETQEKQFPWPRASNVIYPLMAQAAINFAARTYPALVQSRSVVKGVVWGSDKGTPAMQNGQPIMQPPAQPGAPPQPMWLLAPGEKQARADRVGEHMSWQCLTDMPYWEPQLDQLLHQIPIIGGATRKSFRDTVSGKNASYFVSLLNLVWDRNAPSFEDAPRHTELSWKYPHEITELELAGAEEGEDGMLSDGSWLHYDYGPAGGTNTDEGEPDRSTSADGSDPDAPHLFLEQHRRLDLDGDGYPEPYVVTVHQRSGEVVQIVARYDEEDVHTDEAGERVLRIDAEQRYTLFPFLPSIDGGSYPVGFGHLLRPLNESINALINQMIDAGTLANTGAGFIGSGLGIASGSVNVQVGKWIRVDNRGGSVKDNVVPMQFGGPSNVLFQLLGILMSSGEKLASIQDVLTGEAGIANAPPTTVLALIEQGMKTYTAIHKRVFRAMKSEFAKLFRLNRLYMEKPESYRIGDEEREIHPDDYRQGGGVEPIADPTMVTDMQRLGRAQLLMTLRQDPLMDGQKILDRLLTAANIERPEDLFAPPNTALIQLEMALKQAELGKVRAEEQDRLTHAFLNLALARKNATAQEEAFLDQQLTFFRLQIEAINAGTRAATVDHAFHDTATRARTADTDRHARMLEAALDAHLAGGGTLANLPPGLQGGPTGPFPVPPSAPQGPDIVTPASKGTGTVDVPAGPQQFG